MKDNNMYNEQIDRFLKGQMSAEEEQQFKTEIGQNPKLKQQVREHLYLIRGIRQVKAQEEYEILQNVGSKLLVSRRRSWLKIASIAASVAILLTISGIYGRYLYNMNEVRQYAYNASYEVLAEFDVSTRGAMDENVKAHLTLLFSNAQQGINLPETIAELSELYALTKDDFVDVEDDYAFQIGWFLAVAYINDKEYASAKDIIRYLKADYPDDKRVKGLGM